MEWYKCDFTPSRQTRLSIEFYSIRLWGAYQTISQCTKINQNKCIHIPLGWQLSFQELVKELSEVECVPQWRLGVHLALGLAAVRNCVSVSLQVLLLQTRHSSDLWCSYIQKTRYYTSPINVNYTLSDTLKIADKPAFDGYILYSWIIQYRWKVSLPSATV